MECLLVVGLGNPGSVYRDTRHNVGFMVLDELCSRWKCALREGKGEYLNAVIRRSETQIVLLEPTTYMNNSGVAVREALAHWSVNPEQMLVVTDDFALPLGMLRLRKLGSDGGHNGLYSIVYQLGDNVFPRLRCGIGSLDMPGGDQSAGFVLSPFEPAEREAVTAMVRRAGDAVESFVQHGIDRTMNFFNKAP